MTRRLVPALVALAAMLPGCSVALPAGSSARVAADAPLLGDAAAEVAPLDREPTIDAAERRLKVRRVGRRDWTDQAGEFRDCLQQQQFVGAKPCPCYFISEFADNARLSSNDYRDAGCVDALPPAPDPSGRSVGGRAARAPLAEAVARAEGNPGAPYRDAGGAIHNGFGDRADGGDWDRLQANLRLAREDAAAVFGDGYRAAGAVRRDALAELAFVLGRTSLSEFALVRRAVSAGDWREAAAQVLDSDFARSDPRRARGIASRLRTEEAP